MKLFFLAIIVFSFQSQQIFSQSLDSQILKGIDHIYKIEFDSAEVIFDKIISSSPEQPEGYFFKTMIQWWRINIDRQNEEHDAEFYNRVNKTIDVADNLLDKNKRNDKALFYKGGTIGYRGLLRSIRSNWLRAASDGREALNLIEDANKYNQNNPDAIFGLGLYNYFAEYVPENYPVLKPLMILFPKGDKNKGLLQINQAIENSRYAKTEAESILGFLNLRYEKNFSAAETHYRNLHSKFPNNPIFESHLGSALVGQSKWQESINVWESIIAKSDSGFAGYVNYRLLRDANYYAALSLLRLGRTIEGEIYSVQAVELSERIDNADNAFKSFSYLCAGEIFAKNGNKSKAQEYFDRVLSMENFNNIHSEASKRKSEL